MFFYFTACVISLVCYGYIGYFVERSNTLFLLISYGFIFASYIFLIKNYKNQPVLMALALVGFRLVFLFSFPHLSQDYYRFIWDGRMLCSGSNPYLFSPTSVISNGGFIPQFKLLIDGMGELSAGNLSNYPPIHQFPFWIAALLFPKEILGAVVSMRIMIIAADFGVLYIGQKVLKKFQIANYKIYYYLLNPLIIIELTGNLHFEGIMVFFFCLGLLYFKKNKLKRAATSMALAVGTKLIPLLIIPLYVRFLKPKKALLYFGIIGIISLFLFWSIADFNSLQHYLQTTKLWFNTFEFNASFYYLLRFTGYAINGYNNIGIIGLWIGIALTGFILWHSTRTSNTNHLEVLKKGFWIMSFYLFTATTVHPWYLTMLLFLSLFTAYKFGWLWSLTIFLSYTAYHNTQVQESHIALCTEYIPVVALLVYELIHNAKPNPKPL